MRQTEYRRRTRALNDQLLEEVTSATQAELNWLFRQIRYKVRRLDKYRMHVVTANPRLQKSYIVSGNLWDFFVKRMKTSLLSALLRGAIKLFDLQRKHYDLPEVVEIDPAEFAKQIEPMLGERIVGVTDTTKRMVGRKVVGWYNSPGQSMQSLVDQLKPTFSESRARLIAQTEVTFLNSQVQLQTAFKSGVTEWWWSTRRDNVVCVKPLVGPDGQVYKGCRELHGKVFKIGDAMPPTGSHPGCRCNPILVPIKRAKRVEPARTTVRTFVEGLLMRKFDEDQPRDEDGRWTDTGGGSSKREGGFKFNGNAYTGTPEEFREAHKNEHLYHATNKSNLASIKKDGLVSGKPKNFEGYPTPEVALATTTATADYFASLMAANHKDKGREFEPVLLRVKMSDTDAKPYKWHEDEVRSGNISPDKLEMWNGDKWESLVKLTKADFVESEHPRNADGEFTDKDTGDTGGATRTSDDIKTIEDLKEWTDISLPPDDEKYEYFYHGFRHNSDLEAMENEGKNYTTWLSKDEIRDRGSGFAIVRVPKGKAVEGKDFVEEGLVYREWIVEEGIPKEDVVKTVRQVRYINGGGHGINENDLAEYAISHQGTKEDLSDLPEKYRKWFFLNDKSDLTKFDPDQPRDEDGKWTDTGGGGSAEPAYKQSKAYKTYKSHVERALSSKGKEERDDALSDAYYAASFPTNEEDMNAGRKFSLKMMQEDYFDGEIPPVLTVYQISSDTGLYSSNPSVFYTDLNKAKEAIKGTDDEIKAYDVAGRDFYPIDKEMRTGIVDDLMYTRDERNVDLNYERPAKKYVTSKLVDTPYTNKVNEVFNLIRIPKATELYNELHADEALTPEQYVERCEERLKKTLASTNVCVRLSVATLNKVLAQESYKSVFETMRSESGAWDGDRERKERYLNRRREAESEMLGFPKDQTGGRPIYGYLAGKDNVNATNEDLEQYGKVAVVLKDSVRERTTFTLGDSLDDANIRGYSYTIPDGDKIWTGKGSPSKIDDPKIQSITTLDYYSEKDWLTNIELAGATSNRGSMSPEYPSKYNYWEAQVAGGFTVSDIKKVTFIGTPPSESVTKKLAKMGIEWGYEEGEVGKMSKADEPTGKLLAKDDTLELYALDDRQGYVVDTETGKRYPTHEIGSILSRGAWEWVEEEEPVRKFDENQPRDEDGKWTDANLGDSLQYKVREDTGESYRDKLYVPFYETRAAVKREFAIHEQIYAKKLTPEEKNALVEYTDIGAGLNEQLRGGNWGGGEFSEEDIKTLDSALEKASFPKLASVTRYVMADSEAFKQIEQLQGKIIQDAGYLSTSLEADSYAPLLEGALQEKMQPDQTEEESGLCAIKMRINIPKGAHAGLLQGVGDVWSSSEVLLQRNAKLRVNEVYEVTNDDYKVGKFPTKTIVLDLIP